ncbi:MAG: hypothetical protein LH629_07495 [Ignavibacteria bacterium]|nr:hypothetical protein [Ignavibacteria bacterium]
MFETFYEKILPKFPTAEIIGFDTDSFFFYIEVDDTTDPIEKKFDLYKELKDIEDELDMSDYPTLDGLLGNLKKVKDDT